MSLGGAAIERYPSVGEFGKVIGTTRLADGIVLKNYAGGSIEFT